VLKAVSYCEGGTKGQADVQYKRGQASCTAKKFVTNYFGY